VLDKFSIGRLDFVAGMGRHTPGAKALFFAPIGRPKAKALGYLEAKA
jgi:hypothetical protein